MQACPSHPFLDDLCGSKLSEVLSQTYWVLKIKVKVLTYFMLSDPFPSFPLFWVPVHFVVQVL